MKTDETAPERQAEPTVPQARLVRMSEELFQQLGNTTTSEVHVDWGEPTEWVWPLDDPQPEEQPVYTPTITRNFRADLDDHEGWL